MSEFRDWIASWWPLRWWPFGEASKRRVEGRAQRPVPVLLEVGPRDLIVLATDQAVTDHHIADLEAQAQAVIQSRAAGDPMAAVVLVLDNGLYIANILRVTPEPPDAVVEDDVIDWPPYGKPNDGDAPGPADPGVAA